MDSRRSYWNQLRTRFGLQEPARSKAEPQTVFATKASLPLVLRAEVGVAGMGASEPGDPHGLFAFPSDVAVDPNDSSVYVADFAASKVQTFQVGMPR